MHKKHKIDVKNILFLCLFEHRAFRIAIYAILVIVVAIFLIVDTTGNRARLQSLIGVFVLLFLGFIFSAAPRKVIWRHVIWGMALQFVLGAFILRSTLGKELFGCAGQKVSALLGFTGVGSRFVFGNTLAGTEDIPGVFAFSVSETFKMY